MKNTRNTVPSLLIIILLVGFPQISESIFTPILPALSSAFNIHDSVAQLTMSIYFVAFAVGVLFWGILSDTIGRRPAMLLGILCYLIGNIGLFLSPTFPWLLFFRLIQAFGASVGSVITQSMMRESFNDLQRGKIFAQTSAALSLSPAIGPLVGGLVQTYFGYQHVFSTLIVMAVLLLFYSFYRLPETFHLGNTLTKASFWSVAKRLFFDSKVWCYGLLIGGINGLLFSYYAEAPFIFINHFGFSSVQYGFLGLVLAVSSILAAVLINWLLGYWSAEKIAFAGLLLSIFAACCLLIMTQFESIIGLILFIFLFFLGINITLPNALSMALKGYESVIGTASGIFSFVYYLFVSFFTYLISYFHNGTIWVLPLYFLSFACLLAFSYYVIVYRKTLK
ncbi:multidrug effflux MFS transporter [Enterococcus faecalis]|uniref:multidrug effflux MFS transporter n=1 Tax=Enterococcus faecalis TaxID=1351 RepID=UPI0003302EF8|nr:multidrug effflux MFS transporter [Enterococcus faecalis]EOJ71448.1 drug resistance transporter, Bcr/CflA subfamily [Enterococcus faecalis EnGen0352]